MGGAARAGLALLGLVLGCGAGGGIGLLGGLLYTELAGTGSFEGYSGFVVAYWILGGLVIGMIAGLVAALKWSRR